MPMSQGLIVHKSLIGKAGHLTQFPAFFKILFCCKYVLHLVHAYY